MAVSPLLFLGYEVIPNPFTLPKHPTPAEDARRIVRHGLADTLKWLGQDPGPKPGAVTHAILLDARRMIVSEELYLKMHAYLPVSAGQFVVGRFSDPLLQSLVHLVVYGRQQAYEFRLYWEGALDG